MVYKLDGNPQFDLRDWSMYSNILNHKKADFLAPRCSLYTAELKTLYFVFICSVADLFTLTSNKFRMVYKLDGNPQFDLRDWSMYLNILNHKKADFLAPRF